MTEFYLDGPEYNYYAVIDAIPSTKVGAALPRWHNLEVISIGQKGNEFLAKINENYQAFRTRFTISTPARGLSYYDKLHVDSICDCGKHHCQHLLVALQTLLLRQTANSASNRSAQSAPKALTPTEQFLEALEPKPDVASTDASATGTMTDRERLFYLSHDHLVIHTTRRLKNGTLSITRKVEGSWAGALGLTRGYSQSATDGLYYKPDELLAIKHLWLDGTELPEDEYLSLASIKDVSRFFSLLLKTGKVVFDEYPQRPVSLGQAATIDLRWELFDLEAEPQCRLCAFLSGLPRARVLRTTPPWYQDLESGVIGPINTDLPDTLLNLIEQKLAFPLDDSEKVSERLGKHGLSAYLPDLPKIETIDVWDVSPIPVLILRVDYGPPTLLIGAVQFRYGDHEITLTAPNPFLVPGNPRARIHRNADDERRHLDVLEGALGRSMTSAGWIKIESGYDYDQDFKRAILLAQRKLLPALNKAGWEIRFDENIPGQLAIVPAWELRVSKGDSDAWYAVSIEVNIDGVRLNLLEVLKSLLENPRFVEQLRTEAKDTEVTWFCEFATGRYFDVPIAKVKRLARYLLDLTAKEKSATTLKISRFDLSLLEFAGEDTGYRLQGAEDMEALRRRLTAPVVPVAPDDLPAAQVILRDYQSYGVGWLRSRHDAGVGAILGDDMGIGKTAQILSHLWAAHARNASLAPSLIIVPPTLLSQWEIEAAKFYPQFRIGVYHGTARRSIDDLRAESLAILTSYQTLTIQIGSFLPHYWHIVCMDEGHDLRNPKAAKTKACRALKATQKIVITGTVLQNKPEDLWSIMELVVPGLLGDHKTFRSTFVSNKKGEDPFAKDRLALLGKITAPYHLHRSNKEVGNALPAVNTVLRYVDMGEEQRSIYETTRAVLDQDIRNRIAETGLAKNHINVLTAITRLRQICNHPALVKSATIGSTAEAAKLDMLCDMVSDIVDQRAFDGTTGKKLVITSEWVELLDLVKSSIEHIGADITCLDGRMSISARKASLKAFRQGTSNVMLMTLGVGGVGLDIPEAEVIIVLAPWWNPKRIDQAIARLTRDDRHESITAYILVMKDSLEEGVLEIGERKRAMIQAVLDGGDSDETGTLTEADLALLFQSRG